MFSFLINNAYILLSINFHSLTAMQLKALIARMQVQIYLLCTQRLMFHVKHQVMFSCCFILRSFSKNLNKTDRCRTCSAILETGITDQRERHIPQEIEKNWEKKLKSQLYGFFNTKMVLFSCYKIKLNFAVRWILKHFQDPCVQLYS